MATFPVISRTTGRKGSSTVWDKDAVSIASAASGLPVVNTLFTFTPLTFKRTLSLVSTEDKNTIMTFYDTYKGVPFDWYDVESTTTYEVIFMKPPQVTPDGMGGWWKIIYELKQY